MNCEFIRIADDLRQEAQSSSLLGLVVTGNRIVKLETQVNKNQKFIEGESILVSGETWYDKLFKDEGGIFRKDYLYSCALISSSEALAF